MADFSTKLSDPNTQFTQVKARQRPDSRQEQLNSLVGIGTALGKASAREAGAEFTGGDLTQAEVNTQADAAEADLDNQITDAMVAGGGTLQGSIGDQERTQREIKDASLTEFAQNDRVLLELRDRGSISTIEARGRRQLNLKRALSNPINALFKGEFMNAAKSLTGGAKGAVAEIFPYTAEELKSQAILKEQVEAEAEHEGKVASLVASTGRPVSSVRRELQDQAEAEIQMKQIERTKQQRSLNGEEFSLEHGLRRSSSARGLYLDLNKRTAANGGNGLNADDMVAVKRTLDQTYRGMLEAINSNNDGSGTVNIGEAERNSEREKLKLWKEGMEASFEDYDAATLDKNRIAQSEQLADKLGWQYFPDFKVLERISPKIVEIMMLEGGLENIDKFTRKGFGKDVEASVAGIRAATQFSLNKPPENVDVAGTMISAITVGGSSAGIDYVTSPEIQEDKAKKINLAKIYDATPDVALQAYNTIDAQKKAPENYMFRREINDAMTAGLSKMNRIKEMIGAKGEVIFAEPENPVYKGFGSGNPIIRDIMKPNPNWILNLPDGMQENARDLKSMHNMVVRQPWMWNHVKDNYVNGSDAFNGYMRGEWTVNIELLDQPTTDAGASEGGKDLGAAPRISGNDAPITVDRSPIQGEVPAGSRMSRQEIRDRPRKPQEPATGIDPERLTPLLEKQKMPVTAVSRGVTAAELLVGDEGYSSTLPANVPGDTSGITVGGLDIANGDRKAVLKALNKVMTPEKVKEIMAKSKLVGDVADKALAKIDIKLSNEDIAILKESYLKDIVDPILDKQLGKTKVPSEILEPLRALTFLFPGPNSAKSLKKAIDTEKPEDFDKAINNYETFFKNPKGNQAARAQRVADAIKVYKDSILIKDSKTLIEEKFPGVAPERKAELAKQVDKWAKVLPPERAKEIIDELLTDEKP